MQISLFSEPVRAQKRSKPALPIQAFHHVGPFQENDSLWRSVRLEIVLFVVETGSALQPSSGRQDFKDGRLEVGQLS